MKRKSILLVVALLAAMSAIGQTVNTSYLSPMMGGGSPYKYVRFGNEAEYYAGLMWNNNSASYGDGDDFSIFTYDNRDITFRTGTGNFIVFPSQGGNVGIGTTNPQAKLAVNGNIRAKEVKVEMANWPDYVFTEDYKLMPLADLEAHIRTHGHLPGIPTAKEAEAEGIGLAEMNRKLLEKVEELTLHLIEKEKTEQRFQQEMALMKREIAELKAIVKSQLK